MNNSKVSVGALLTPEQFLRAQFHRDDLYSLQELHQNFVQRKDVDRIMGGEDVGVS